MLDRGYAVVQRADRHVVRAPGEAGAGDPIERVAGGGFAASVLPRT
jgi:exodeoxyribonuclease VII large subunit